MKTFLSPLTPEQENECLKKLKKGSLEARNELTLHNMRLVAHVAKKYQNSEEDMEDLISIGTIGLMKAIATYKEDYGSRLATYAARCIDNELLMMLRSRKKLSREVSLYEPIGQDKEGNAIHLLDVIEEKQKDIVEDMELGRNIRRLFSALDHNESSCRSADLDFASSQQRDDESGNNSSDNTFLGRYSRSNTEGDGQWKCYDADNDACHQVRHKRFFRIIL